MTPAEIVARWMQPKPEDPPANGYNRPGGHKDKFHWWRSAYVSGSLPDGIIREWKPIFDVCPEVEKLGRLHEVEARLTEERQWHAYKCALYREITGGDNHWPSIQQIIHATAEQKLRALAAVLESEVSHAD